MKTAATHWKRAAPSMLTVAPMGKMKRLMCLDTPLFSSTHFIIRGRVAELRDRKCESETTKGMRVCACVSTREPQYLKYKTQRK